MEKLTPKQKFEFAQKLMIAAGRENTEAREWIVANRRKRKITVDFCILQLKAFLGDRFNPIALEILNQMKTEGAI